MKIILKNGKDARMQSEYQFYLLTQSTRKQFIADLEKQIETKIFEGEKVLYVCIEKHNKNSYWYYWNKDRKEKRYLKKYLKNRGYKGRFVMGNEFDIYDNFKIKW